MKLLLVRHGQTDSNLSLSLDTAMPGAPLNNTGLQQAAVLPDYLSQQGLLTTVSSLWVSPILRARQTIASLEQALGMTAAVREGLREVNAGDLEMANDEVSTRCYIDTSRSWMVGRLGCRMPGADDGRTTLRRFDDVVEEIAAHTQSTAGEAGTALLLAHGTVLRLWTALQAAKLAGVDPAWIAERPMQNTAVSVVSGQPGKWRLESWNNGEFTA